MDYIFQISNPISRSSIGWGGFGIYLFWIALGWGGILKATNEISMDTSLVIDSLTVERKLKVSAGSHRAALRDYGFSPLIYSGSVPSVGLDYSANSDRQHNLLWIGISYGKLNNRHNAEMTAFSAEIYTLQTFKWDRLPDGLMLGWSNRNVFQSRNFSEAQNFNPRFDYHTNFGLALQYRRDLSNYLPGLEISISGQFQVIGFFIQSGYVTNAPSGAEEEGNGGLQTTLQSIRIFHPLEQSDWGLWPGATYHLASGSSISLTYRYNRTVLEDRHRSESSRGNILLTLMMPL